jgi:hypothetical protein
VYRRSLLSDRLSTRFLPSRKRSAGTPPSTFLFLLIYFSNSPGPMKVPSPENRRAVEARHPTKPDAFPTEKSCGSSEARHRADVRQRAEELIYRVSRARLSTLVSLKSRAGIAPVTQYLIGFLQSTRANAAKGRRAAVTPHSSAVLAAGINASGALRLVTPWKSASAGD